MLTELIKREYIEHPPKEWMLSTQDLQAYYDYQLAKAGDDVGENFEFYVKQILDLNKHQAKCKALIEECQTMRLQGQSADWLEKYETYKSNLSYEFCELIVETFRPIEEDSDEDYSYIHAKQIYVKEDVLSSIFDFINLYAEEEEAMQIDEVMKQKANLSEANMVNSERYFSNPSDIGNIIEEVLQRSKPENE